MCITVSEYEYATGRVHVFLVKSRYPPIPMEVPDQLRSGRVFVPTNSSLLGLPGVIVTPPELRVNTRRGKLSSSARVNYLRFTYPK